MKQKKHAPLRYWAVFLAVTLMTLAGSETVDYAGTETAAVKKFQLYATDGYLTLPDGNKLYIWR
jgi:hypothetical protein